MPKPPIPSPFHRGERDIQARKGVRAQIEDIGQRFIRDHLPDEHREFYGQLPILLIGSVDKSGRPWASVLVGRPGFVQSPDPETLAIAARPIFGDPLNEHIAPGAIGATPVTHRRWQSALPTQNAVQQRHHPRCVRAVGFSGAPGRAGAQATGEPHSLPR